MLNINGTLMRICHPASWRGSGLITTPYPGLTPWAMESVALSGSKFLGLSARQISIYCAEGGFFQNVADISILYKIFGTRVICPAAHENMLAPWIINRVL